MVKESIKIRSKKKTYLIMIPVYPTGKIKLKKKQKYYSKIPNNKLFSFKIVLELSLGILLSQTRMSNAYLIK